MQGTICISNCFCAMDSQAWGLHLTRLSSVARSTNWFCDWRMDQWISPPFHDGCAGRLQMWPCMLRAGLHRGGWDLSSPTVGPTVHLMARDGDKWGHCRRPTHPITLSQHGNSRCQSGPQPFTKTGLNWQKSVKSLCDLPTWILEHFLATNVESLHSICLCYDRNLIWARAVTLQLKKCDILGKDAFFPPPFSP